MKVTSRFTIAVHILCAVQYFKDESRLGSAFLAGSVGANPAIVRGVISDLSRAGLLTTRQGSSGATLARPLSDISFLDVYEAVDAESRKAGLFRFHEEPSPDCPVGRNIHKALDGKLSDVQAAMEQRMGEIRLSDVYEDIEREIRRDSLGSSA